MTFTTFNLLSTTAQLNWVLQHGIYLARRWEEEGGINLYHCRTQDRGFFAELRYHERADSLQILRIFADTEPLEGYAYYVRLPDLG